jgi:succinate dehydrogenase / fumarate reductase cytochrome b subunit
MLHSKKGRPLSQVKADAKGPVSGAARARPLSPHLQIWRWHITMAASIATRASGVALYVGVLIVAGLAAALAAGPDAYSVCIGLLSSPVGMIVLFGLTVSIFYHLAAGLRHLVFDSGKGFAPATANATAWASFAFAAVASVLVWAGYFLFAGH